MSQEKIECFAAQMTGNEYKLDAISGRLGEGAGFVEGMLQ